jgi:hypothetical protein
MKTRREKTSSTTGTLCYLFTFSHSLIFILDIVVSNEPTGCGVLTHIRSGGGRRMSDEGLSRSLAIFPLVSGLRKCSCRVATLQSRHPAFCHHSTSVPWAINICLIQSHRGYRNFLHRAITIHYNLHLFLYYTISYLSLPGSRCGLQSDHLKKTD